MPKAALHLSTSMDVHDERIPEETFGACLDALPQVCVEVVLDDPDGDGVLVAYRTNEPAKGEWFWPGTRLYKGEELDDAAHRVGREELGIEIDLRERVGVYSHFWDTSSVDGVDSRHTVNIVYRASKRDPDAAISLDDQHDDYQYVFEQDDALHDYVNQYLDDAGIEA